MPLTICGLVLTGVTLLEGAQGLDENGLLALAAALEARSEHPLAQALIKAGHDRNLPACRVEEVLVAPGMGIAGDVFCADVPRHVAVGNRAFMKEYGLAVSDDIAGKLAVLAEAGQTPLLLALGRVANVEMPYTQAMISMAELIVGEDFLAGNDLIDHLGLASSSVERLLSRVRVSGVVI